MNTDPRYIYWLIYICPFLKYGMEYGGARTYKPWFIGTWLVWHILGYEVHSCILFKPAARGSRIFSNLADILTEIIHLSEYTYSQVLYVKTEFMRMYERLWKYGVWLWKMIVWPMFSCEVHSCIKFKRAARGSRYFF